MCYICIEVVDTYIPCQLHSVVVHQMSKGRKRRVKFAPIEGKGLPRYEVSWLLLVEPLHWLSWELGLVDKTAISQSIHSNGVAIERQSEREGKRGRGVTDLGQACPSPGGRSCQYWEMCLQHTQKNLLTKTLS